jgi:hypothetical protein
MEMNVEHWWNDTDRERTKVLGENLSQCHFTIDLTWTYLGLDTGKSTHVIFKASTRTAQ